jgi:glycosyltransferase involved in cell wall biosynthesis
LTGHLEVADVVELFSGAGAFVFPSAWEGFGLPLLEAMSLGLPCVVSDGGALPEVAADGAVVVPVGDTRSLTAAVAELLHDSRRADDMSRRATTRASAFTPEAFRRGHVAAYAAS